ncbi:PKD domain-containing protein [Microbispora oryzae]|uniref:PKD domain-containing protein n=1 Tax=Microbispora oryzae TaxID=2806554 RepID=UPI001E3C15DB|nr:PKD domain-containing protein [Microbispora oryzae]
MDTAFGPAPLTVNFSSAGSSDPEGGSLSYSWAFGDGTISTSANPSKTYTTNGTYTATLTVRDPQGLTGTASVTVNVGNTAPSVTLNSPVAGRLFSFGETVPFQVTVSDPEDGTIGCSGVTVTYFLGHDGHATRSPRSPGVLGRSRRRSTVSTTLRPTSTGCCRRPTPTRAA